MGKLDQAVAETEDTIVKSSRNMFRYRKKFKDGISTGRKQGRFHIKDKVLRLVAGTNRRD